MNAQETEIEIISAYRRHKLLRARVLLNDMSSAERVAFRNMLLDILNTMTRMEDA